MRSYATLLVLALGSAQAGDKPSLDLPVVTGHREAPPADQTLDLFVDRDGRMHVLWRKNHFGGSDAATPVKPGFERVPNLNMLGFVVGGAAAWFKVSKPKEGPRGTELAPDNTVWSRMHVVLHVDRGRPWIYAQWVLAVLHEKRIRRVWLAGAGGARVRTWLPWVARGGEPPPIEYAQPIGAVLPTLAKALPARFFGDHAPPQRMRGASRLERPDKVPPFSPWRGPPPPPTVPTMRLPDLEPDPFESEHATIRLHLSGDRRLLVDESQLAFGESAAVKILELQTGLRETNLDGLGSFLHRARAMYELECRKRGLEGTVRKGDADKSALHVLLHVDRDAPWLHVQWTATILAEQQFYRLWFVVPKGRVRAFLPTHYEEIENARNLVVDVTTPAGSPKTVRYGFDGHETDSLAPLRAWLAARSARKDRPRVGRLRFTRRAPCGPVLAALVELERAGLDHVVFLANAIPGAEVRGESRLPQPDSNELCRLWDEGLDEPLDDD